MEKHTIINIGRQFGSGGKSVAAALGEKLGITVYDDELIAKASETSGYSASILTRNDEKRHLLSLGNLFGSNRYGTFTRNMLSGDELFRIQSEAIRDIAGRGDAIFVGRASDYVLRDMDCLDVFISAPLPARIVRVAERLGISEVEAADLIARKDKGRESWYNLFTFSHWGVASNYDLCVDSSILGIDGTAEYIIDFLNRKNA